MSQATMSQLRYFETIEAHFNAVRGSGFFTFSPLDWALIETWQSGGIPLEAVLRGIDQTFETWRRRPARTQTQRVNSLAYCTQEVMKEAERMADSGPIGRSATKPPCSLDAVWEFSIRNAESLRGAGFGELAFELESLQIDVLYLDLEELEQRLIAIEQKLITKLRAAASSEILGKIQRELDLDLKPYRGKLTVEQLEMLEKQFFERRLLESAGVPRLSLFYL